MNLIEQRNANIDQLFNAQQQGMCNQEILKLALQVALKAHLLDRELRAKINGTHDGPLTQDFFDGLIKQSAGYKLQIERLELKCKELDVERRAYITEIESLEARCVRLESELVAMRLLSEHNRLSAGAANKPA